MKKFKLILEAVFLIVLGVFVQWFNKTAVWANKRFNEGI